MCYGRCSNEIICGPEAGECKLIHPTEEDCKENMIGGEEENA